jgi:N-hydroxyarylamine O-acetyltransferase
MELQAYFDRIGFSGEARPDLATLKALHRAHLWAIPYENFDVQFGRATTTAPAAAYDKIVGRGRGGWCYEMNGLFGAMLEAVGFKVTRMAGAVARDERGEIAHGNHLVLRVDLDRPYIADVGFGDGMLEPTPLAEGPVACAGYDFRLEALSEGWMRFHNHAMGGAPYFDFRDTPAQEEELAGTCAYLSTSPDSIFTQTALAFRHTPGGIKVILGRVLRHMTPGAKTTHLMASADEFVDTLQRDFGLDLPDAAGLWPAICAKHDELFGERAES